MTKTNSFCPIRLAWLSTIDFQPIVDIFCPLLFMFVSMGNHNIGLFIKCFENWPEQADAKSTTSYFLGPTFIRNIQARIAQLIAYRLGTWVVPGSNPGEGENFSMKINNWSNSNLNGAAISFIFLDKPGSYTVRTYVLRGYLLTKTTVKLVFKS